MKNPIISVEGLSKGYRIGVGNNTSDTMIASLVGFMRSPFRGYQRLRRLNKIGVHECGDDVLWALRDVNFHVEQGEVLGVLGGNGAGKSTLLKVLSRITEPTSGRIKIQGRVSSLLEVGTGFHPELTGRENIYMNGTILGMSKREIDRKFEEIVEFSGVEKFLDTPTKRYSSGMQVRLAFAVAAHLEPEILIVDEVLAVGDVGFQKKCIGKMKNVAAGGRTVLFVSHNMQALQQLCTRGIVMNRGMLEASGSVPDMITVYMNQGGTVADATGFQDLSGPEIQRSGCGSARLTGVRVEELADESVPGRRCLNIRIFVSVDESIDRIAVVLSLTNATGLRVFQVNSRDDDRAFEQQSGGTERIIDCQIDELNLVPGSYQLDIALQAPPSREPLDYVIGATQMQIEANSEHCREATKRGLVYFPSHWRFLDATRERDTLAISDET